MERLLKFLNKYNLCFVPCHDQSKEQNTDLLRNIKALGYDSIKISGHFKESDKKEEFIGVLSGSHYKESKASLTNAILGLCEKHNIESVICFGAGTLTGDTYHKDGSFTENSSSAAKGDQGLVLRLNGAAFVTDHVSEVMDHRIRTMSQYKSYSK